MQILGKKYQLRLMYNICTDIQCISLIWHLSKFSWTILVYGWLSVIFGILLHTNILIVQWKCISEWELGEKKNNINRDGQTTIQWRNGMRERDKERKIERVRIKENETAVMTKKTFTKYLP